MNGFIGIGDGPAAGSDRASPGPRGEEMGGAGDRTAHVGDEGDESGRTDAGAGSGGGFRPGRARRGFVLSVEALLSALLLISFIMLASNLSLAAGEKHDTPLGGYAQELLTVGLRGGEWQDALPPRSNDTRARGLIESLPAAWCVQAEAYEANTSAASLRWSYVRTGCGLRDSDTPIEQRWGAVLQRLDRQNSTYYWIRIRAYPRGG